MNACRHLAYLSLGVETSSAVDTYTEYPVNLSTPGLPVIVDTYPVNLSTPGLPVAGCKTSSPTEYPVNLSTPGLPVAGCRTSSAVDTY